jgi:hypothetical protein
VLDTEQNGATIIEIADSLNVVKSSAWEWVKNVELTDEAKKRIDGMSDKGKFKKGIFRHGATYTDEMKNALSIRSKERYNNNADIRYNLTLGNSVHRKNEAAIKNDIERFFDTSELLPQKINNHWFDFVNDEFVIEYTIDITKGISLAISRFDNIIDDNRKKILISPEKWFGPYRRSLLNATGATFIPIDMIKRNVGSNLPGVSMVRSCKHLA